MGDPRMAGLDQGKSQSKMDDLEVPPFQENLEIDSTMKLIEPSNHSYIMLHIGQS